MAGDWNCNVYYVLDWNGVKFDLNLIDVCRSINQSSKYKCVKILHSTVTVALYNGLHLFVQTLSGFTHSASVAHRSFHITTFTLYFV